MLFLNSPKPQRLITSESNEKEIQECFEILPFPKTKLEIAISLLNTSETVNIEV